MTCRNCGASVAPTDHFCASCGARIEALRAPEASAWVPPGDPGSPWTRPAELDERPSLLAPPAYAAPPAPWVPPDAASPLSSFGAPLATWWQRVGAMLLDMVVLMVPAGIVDGVLGVLAATHHSPAPVVFAAWVVPLLYFGLFSGLGTGQTPGDRAPGISVRDAVTGRTIGGWRGVARTFVRFALYATFLVPGLLNDLFPLWDKKRQSLADKVVRSVVVKMPS